MSIDLQLAPRCPMCGTEVAAVDTTCEHCGEPLVPEVDEELTTPIYSLKQIGVCTFFWSLLAGFVLLWLNCRKLGLARESHQVAVFGVFGFVVLCVLCAVMAVLPEISGLGLVVNVVQALVVVNIGQRILGRQFALQRQQRGPYASTWKAHGIGLLVVLALLGIVMAMVVALGEMGLLDDV